MENMRSRREGINEEERQEIATFAEKLLHIGETLVLMNMWSAVYTVVLLITACLRSQRISIAISSDVHPPQRP
jgi:hypothetical protein